MNKSLIAIKEYGMLFECPYNIDKEGNKKFKIDYWVIGYVYYNFFFTTFPFDMFVNCKKKTFQATVLHAPSYGTLRLLPGFGAAKSRRTRL